MLPEDATDAGLLGVSFFGGRGLSIPFSGGEWAGLARGVAGSWRNEAVDFNIYIKQPHLSYMNLEQLLCSSPRWTHRPPSRHFSLRHCPVMIINNSFTHIFKTPLK